MSRTDTREHLIYILAELAGCGPHSAPTSVPDIGARPALLFSL